MKSHTRLHTIINLHLFDGEGAGGGTATSNGETGNPTAPVTKGKAERNPLANVQYGKQVQTQPEQNGQTAQKNPTAKADPQISVTSDTQEARKAEFEKLIKGDYKDLFDARVQQNINARFKELEGYKSKAAQVDALNPVLELLASKYGVDGSDVDSLVKAIQEDDSYYEEEALQKGLTVEQLKHMKKIERENADFKRMAQEQQARQNRETQFAKWAQQSEECQRIYPNFDLKAEVSNVETGKRFLSLLSNGVDVQTAFEVVHKDELIGGAMQYTAQAIQQKTVNDIRARGMRPSENGASGNGAAVIVKKDPRTFTRQDREEISRRVMRGERIEL